MSYKQYKSDEIVVGQSISFVNLKVAIAAKLEIDETRKNLKVRYMLEDNSSPMMIRNGIKRRLYIEVKKMSPNLQCICYKLIYLIRLMKRYNTSMLHFVKSFCFLYLIQRDFVYLYKIIIHYHFMKKHSEFIVVNIFDTKNIFFCLLIF